MSVGSIEQRLRAPTPLGKIRDNAIAAAILETLADRDAESSCCPSDIARALMPGGEGWRALMPRVREIAIALAREKKVKITRGSLDLSEDDLGAGPIRLRRGPRFVDAR